MFSIVFQKCDPKWRKCKSEAEIEAFLSGKSILYFDNEMHYKHQNDHSSEGHIDKFSKHNWINIST